MSTFVVWRRFFSCIPPNMMRCFSLLHFIVHTHHTRIVCVCVYYTLCKWLNQQQFAVDMQKLNWMKIKYVLMKSNKQLNSHWRTHTHTQIYFGSLYQCYIYIAFPVTLEAHEEVIGHTGKLCTLQACEIQSKIINIRFSYCIVDAVCKEKWKKRQKQQKEEK